MPTADLGSVSIHYEETGPSDAPAILLVMGLGSQMVYWPPRLVDALAEDHRVISFDNRDVGLSSWDSRRPIALRRVLAGQLGVPVSPPPYTLTDMAADAVGLLDQLDVDRAHVLGVSMGGMIAQRIAIHHPERVRSLAVVMSSSGTRAVPPAKPRAIKSLLTKVPRHDRDAYVESVTRMRAAIASTGFATDPDFIREAIGTAFDRGVNPAGFVRQMHAIAADGDRTPLLRTLDVPTVVVHGSADPLVHHRAGRSVADAVPGARFRLVQGMGHDLPPAVCDLLAEEVRTLVGTTT